MPPKTNETREKKKIKRKRRRMFRLFFCSKNKKFRKMKTREEKKQQRGIYSFAEIHKNVIIFLLIFVELISSISHFIYFYFDFGCGVHSFGQKWFAHIMGNLCKRRWIRFFISLPVFGVCVCVENKMENKNKRIILKYIHLYMYTHPNKFLLCLLNTKDERYKNLPTIQVKQWMPFTMKFVDVN